MKTNLDQSLLKIDALLRQATSLIWSTLQPEKRNPEDLQSEALRLLMRSVQNLSDDLTVFGNRQSEEAPKTGGIYAKVRERHPNTGKPWTSEADDELRKLFESGNSIEDLAVYFQRTQNGVRARLVKFGLLAPEQFQARFVA
jgi:hypothetical protein